MKVSMIIPAYNTEKKIGRCLESLIEQSYDEIEIIVINDGSTDGTLSVIKKYASKDCRIIIINKFNEGVSAARNDGIRKASGDYILFVDSDDYIHKNTVEDLIKSLAEHSDGVVFGYKLEGYEDSQSDLYVLKKMRKNNSGTCNSLELIKSIISINPEKEILGYSVRFLYKLSIIKDNNILFDTTLKISEDYKFIVEYLSYSKQLSILDKCLYVYDFNESSTTFKYIPSLHGDMKDVNDWIKDYIYILDNELELQHRGCIANTYLNFVQNIAKKDSEYSFKEALKNIYKVKNEYNYMYYIRYTVNNLKCRRKSMLAFIMFSLNMDFVYFALYYIKRRYQ